MKQILIIISFLLLVGCNPDIDINIGEVNIGDISINPDPDNETDPTDNATDPIVDIEPLVRIPIISGIYIESDKANCSILFNKKVDATRYCFVFISGESITIGYSVHNYSQGELGRMSHDIRSLRTDEAVIRSWGYAAKGKLLSPFMHNHTLDGMRIEATTIDAELYGIGAHKPSVCISFATLNEQIYISHDYHEPHDRGCINRLNNPLRRYILIH